MLRAPIYFLNKKFPRELFSLLDDFISWFPLLSIKYTPRATMMMRRFLYFNFQRGIWAASKYNLSGVRTPPFPLLTIILYRRYTATRIPTTQPPTHQPP